jgi:hypothetical protein
MTPKRSSEATSTFDLPSLNSDDRWLLVQRITASEEFRRAEQLRNILQFVTRSALLNPGKALSEIDIAVGVLNRPQNFDPAYDNIVRAQISHLRKRLADYFESEGRDEAVVLTIPRGSYLPVFSPAPARSATSTRVDSIQAEERKTSPGAEAGSRSARAVWKRLHFGLTIVFALAFLIVSFAYWRTWSSKVPVSNKDAGLSPFVRDLARFNGDVIIVIPDTSFAILQTIVGKNIPLSEYVRQDFPEDEITALKDQELRSVIQSDYSFRSTSVNEALIGTDFLESLRQAGVHAVIRYARDIHVEDLNQNNSILIGGPNSDPWGRLFSEQKNFLHVDDLTKDTHFFENRHRLAGEQASYENIYSNPEIAYVDVTLTQNALQTGYVLMIDGADMQANESASRFLLHGQFPAEMATLLNRPDLRSFEIFLRSKHITGQADDSFDLVALRPK